jgi:hypothetical protein
MPSISSFSDFTGWQGRLHAASRRIAPLPPRPGVNGRGYVVDAWGSEPQQIATVDAQFTSASLAQDELDAYRTCVDGGTVTAVDPLGNSWTVLVENVVGTIDQLQSGKFRLAATWTLTVVAAEP